RRLQAVLDLVPEGRAPQGPLDDVVELALLADAVDLRAERDVVVDALRERVRPLEDHPDAPADFGRRDVRSVQVDAVVHQRALDPSGGDEVVHAVETPEYGGLAATRRPDECRDLLGADRQVDFAYGAERAVVDGETLDVEHKGRIGVFARFGA